MEWLRFGELQVAYRRAGSGPPLVVLPGALDDGRWWERQLRGLSDAFTIVVWDAPGCGRSDDPPASWSLADFASCAAALVEEVAGESAHVLGLSFGGALAIEFFHRHRERVRSLVLVSAYAGWLGSLGPDATAERVAAAQGMVTMSADERVAAWLPTLLAPSTDGQTRAWAEALVRDMRTTAAPTLARSLAVDLRGVLPAIDVPTLVVHGIEDVRAPREVADELVALVPGAELVTIEGAGHLVNVDAPEELARAVREFVDRQERI